MNDEGEKDRKLKIFNSKFVSARHLLDSWNR